MDANPKQPQHDAPPGEPPQAGDEPANAEQAAKPAGLLRLPLRLVGWIKTHPKIGVPAIAVALLAAVGLLFLLFRSGEIPADKMLARALVLLESRENPSAWKRARTLAYKVKNTDYRDPNFSGATEFVLGIVSFRIAQHEQRGAGEADFAAAAKLLKQAEVHTVDTAHRPEWCYALGTSLYAGGARTQSIPYLLEALETYEPGQIETTERLIELYLENRDRASLESGLELNTVFLNRTDLSKLQREQTLLQRAELLLDLGTINETEDILGQIPANGAVGRGATVLKARILFSQKHYDEALSILKPVASDVGLNRSVPRQASYMMGLCAEELANEARLKNRNPTEVRAWIEDAINAYKFTARTYKATPEGIAANLKLGTALRQLDANEEALTAFQGALEMVRDPAEFRNRWLTVEEFRKTIDTVWNDWIEAKQYQYAIDLSRYLIPLVSPVEAYTHAALAHQRWAEALEDEIDKGTHSQQLKRITELKLRWRACGQAYDALANTVSTTADYPKNLWLSAACYRKGHDFENALRQINTYIKVAPQNRMPEAMVERGAILMDCNRSPDDLHTAMRDFEIVISEYPNDPAAFQARYLKGQCHIELNELDLAENAWTSIIRSRVLTPDAREWRMALLALGRFYYSTGEMLKSPASDAPDAQPKPQSTRPKIPEAAFARWTMAIDLLDEFLKRYPNDPAAPEARYLLARSLRETAHNPHQKMAAAETENARVELRTAMQERLRNALGEFRQLQTQLVALGEKDHLDDLGRQMLRNSYFEIAHIYYALDNFEEAIVAYGSAANRNPHDPRILLAYIQMSNCYERLGKEVEARSMIEQARIILRQLKDLPNDPFRDNDTGMDYETWQGWLDWARQLYHAPDAKEPTKT